MISVEMVLQNELLLLFAAIVRSKSNGTVPLVQRP